MKRAVLIAGPTASGKSALALDIAAKNGGIVVNTDSMQVYSVLEVLTARPSVEEQARVVHALYGHIHPGNRYSTGTWLADVRDLISEPELSGRPFVFVGGTGLYFRALLGGLSKMPDIPDEVRRRWRYSLAEDGASKLHRLLRTRDPEAAMVIKPADGQRVVRALEVLEVSGRSILKWQSDRGQALVDQHSAELIIVEPARELAGEAIAARFDRMIERGAIDEVKALVDLNLDPDLPAMKAIGVRELCDAIDGRMTMEEAVARAKIATRQYAKRQLTWFRNQCGPEWKRLCAGEFRKA